MNTFSIKEALSFGWKTFRSRPWLFIGTEVVLFAVSAVTQLPERLTHNMTGMSAAFIGILAFLISTVISFLLDMGKTSFYLHAHDSVEAASYHDLWHPRPFWKYVATSIAAGLATIIGLILLIIPGIIIGIMVAFSTYIVIDTGMGPIEAIKHSAELTKGHRWHLLRFGLALLGVNILGLAVLIVGLLVSIPVSILAVVHVYRKLSSSQFPLVTATSAE
jgi:uncharacterized membrane protein